MTDKNGSRNNVGKPYVLSGIAIAIAVVIGAIFVGFLIFYTLREPERIANPADIGSPEVPREGVAVPDGGDLTSEPTQAAPDSPARDMDVTD